MWLLYQIFHVLALVFVGPFLALGRGKVRHYVKTLPGRLTFHRAPPAAGASTDGRRPLWIHAVSVGEVAVAETLVAALPAGEPLLVTTVTPTGQAQARKRLGHRATVDYLPFDLGLPLARFFRRHRPRALVLVESEYWPLVLRQARRRGLPVVVVNGRVGDKTFRRLHWLGRVPVLRRLPALLHDPVDRFAVQSRREAERLRDLGVAAQRITVTGNLKFEAPAPPPIPPLEEALGKLAGGRPILLAGSTMAHPEGGADEEGAVLDAFAAAGGGDRALLLLAPRHDHRWDAVARRLEERGLPAVRRSLIDDGGAIPDRIPHRPAVVLLDSFGDLAALYRLAFAAFIGGTLVPTGGHNPLEAARFGVPVVVGPSLDNFRDMAAMFRDAEAWAEVADAAELGRTWSRWLDDPEAAREVGAEGQRLVDENRGAVERTLAVLGPEILGTGGRGVFDTAADTAAAEAVGDVEPGTANPPGREEER